MVATIALVHGGGATRRFWDRLRPLLSHPSVAVDLPGRNEVPGDLATITVDDEVAAVVDQLAEQVPDGPLLLVAHSSGGLVVPGVVAALDSRVRHIVLNAALVPSEGGDGTEGMQPRHAEGLRAAIAAAGEGGPAITLPAPADPESLRRSYGGEPLDDETLAFVSDPVRCVADTVHHYFQPVHWSLAARVPVTYVVNDADRPIPRELQLEMIERLPQRPAVVHLPGGHIPAVTDPARFAAIVNDVARTIP